MSSFLGKHSHCLRLRAEKERVRVRGQDSESIPRSTVCRTRTFWKEFHRKATWLCRQAAAAVVAVLARSVGSAADEVSVLCQPGDWAMLMAGAVGSGQCWLQDL